MDVDLFSGVGGVTQGLRKAGFKTLLAFEIDDIASKAFKLNHKYCKFITDYIRNINIDDNFPCNTKTTWIPQSSPGACR